MANLTIILNLSIMSFNLGHELSFHLVLGNVEIVEYTIQHQQWFKIWTVQSDCWARIPAAVLFS